MLPFFYTSKARRSTHKKTYDSFSCDILVLSLLPWSGTQPAVSLRSAGIWSLWLLRTAISCGTSSCLICHSPHSLHTRAAHAFKDYSHMRLLPMCTWDYTHDIREALNMKDSNVFIFYIPWISISYNYIHMSYINVHKGKTQLAVAKFKLIDKLQVQHNDFWAMKRAWMTGCRWLYNTAILSEWSHQYFRACATAQNSAFPRSRVACSTQANCHTTLWEVPAPTLETFSADCSAVCPSVR